MAVWSVSTEGELGGYEFYESMICGKELKSEVCITFYQEDLRVKWVTFFSYLEGLHMEDDTVSFSTDPKVRSNSYMICWASGHEGV